MIRKISILFILVFIITTALAYAEEQSKNQNAFIPAGTPIAVELTDPVTSQSTFVGETLTVSVLEDIIINNVAVIEKGSKGFIKVIDVKRSGNWGKSGGIVIEPQYVKTANYIMVPLAGTVGTNGQGHSAMEIVPFGAAGGGKSWPGDVGIGALASIIFFPNSSPGESATIPAGTKLIMTTRQTVDMGVTADELWNSINTVVKKRSTTPAYESSKQNWTGEYISSRGKIILRQEKNSNVVTGKYERSNGTLRGTIVGDRLIGKWTEEPSDKAVSGNGYFEFLMSSDGNSILMLWRQDYSNNWMEDKLAGRLSGW